jgi:hypothetical protein
MMELALSGCTKKEEPTMQPPDHRPPRSTLRASGSRVTIVVTDLFARSWLRGDPHFENLANEIHLPRIFLPRRAKFPKEKSKRSEMNSHGEKSKNARKQERKSPYENNGRGPQEILPWRHPMRQIRFAIPC